jgi:hypothetical protein
MLAGREPKLEPSRRLEYLRCMPASAAGFWSYVHADDAAEGGRIVRLARMIGDQFALLTGNDLELFIDRDVEWGEQWRKRISQAIAGTTFFIPIVTPRYFVSAECRRELVEFTGKAKSSGLQELLLPVYYVEVPGLEEDEPSDDAMRLISQTQWVDWRKLGLRDEGSAEFRQGLRGMAQRLAGIAERVSAVPDAVAASPAPPSGGEPGEAEESEPGVVELLVEADKAMPRFQRALDGLGQEIKRIEEVTTEWTPRLERAAAKGPGPAMAVFGQIANALDPSAARIEELGQEYANELVTIDPAVQSLIRMVETGLQSREDATETLDGIRELNVVSGEAVSQLTELLNTMDQVASLSRDLRRPLRRMRTGLRNIVDGHEVLAEWGRRVDQLDGDSSQTPSH